MVGKNEYIYEELTYKIIGCSYEVHRNLGSIHKENIYHNALVQEFTHVELPFSEEKSIPVEYKGKRVGVYKPDFIIDEKVILEIKAVPFVTKAMTEQIYYYAKGTRYKLVLLINFGTRKVGIKRLIYT
ncbi:MAG: GxxExxY protein [Candidatus Omnitrophota bacterium]